MECESLSIAAVKVFTPRQFADDRGYFMETFSARTLSSLGVDLDFVQDNESHSRDAFTVRGLHYQAPPFAQDKLVRVIRGRVFDAVVDVRAGSPTYGQWAGAELSADNRRQLLAPKGFLHGFMTLEPDTLVAYKVTAFYDGPSDGAVKWDTAGIQWPTASAPVTLSAKDAAAPAFADFDSPFTGR